MEGFAMGVFNRLHICLLWCAYDVDCPILCHIDANVFITVSIYICVGVGVSFADADGVGDYVGLQVWGTLCGQYTLLILILFFLLLFVVQHY